MDAWLRAGVPICRATYFWPPQALSLNNVPVVSIFVLHVKAFNGSDREKFLDELVFTTSRHA